MENRNNLTLREQIILKLLDKSLEYGDIYDIADVRIAAIHDIADKLCKIPSDNNIPGSDVPLDTPIDVIEMPAVGLNALMHKDIRTIGDLVRESRRDMLRIRSFGKTSLTAVENFMKAHNLKFTDQQ